MGQHSVHRKFITQTHHCQHQFGRSIVYTPYTRFPNDNNNNNITIMIHIDRIIFTYVSRVSVQLSPKTTLYLSLHKHQSAYIVNQPISAHISPKRTNSNNFSISISRFFHNNTSNSEEL